MDHHVPVNGTVQAKAFADLEIKRAGQRLLEIEVVGLEHYTIIAASAHMSIGIAIDRGVENDAAMIVAIGL
jgi:hypothetical protein